uniref:cysteine desulfurase n=1 Tax=Eutreptiella gymnastica TaxID=73025 RepID=A0A7S4G7Z7_9EUGL
MSLHTQYSPLHARPLAWGQLWTPWISWAARQMEGPAAPQGTVQPENAPIAMHSNGTLETSLDRSLKCTLKSSCANAVKKSAKADCKPGPPKSARAPQVGGQTPGDVWKQDFEFLSRCHKDTVYLDSAATTHKPTAVVNALTRFYTQDYATVHRAVYSLSLRATDMHHAVREKVRSYINAAHNDEIIFTRGATESINMVASCFGRAFIHPEDEIVVTEIEHHSNLVPWQMLCKERGAHLRICRVTDKGELDLAHLQQLLSSGKVKLVACAHMSNVLGTIHPIRKVVEMAHSMGAKVLVDGAQMAAHGNVDVQGLGADFYAFSGHKLYGPTGVGVLFGRRQLLRAMPPWHGGGDMISEVRLQSSDYAEPPLKFEAGTPPIAEIIGLGAALDYIVAQGLPNIQRWEQRLLQYATERLASLPQVQIVGQAPEKGPIISFVVKGAHHLDVGTLLDLKGVAVRTGHHCCQTAMQRFQLPGTVRISFGLYNSFSDVDRFIDALQAALRDLGL